MNDPMCLEWVTNSPDPYSPGYMPYRMRNESYLEALKSDREFFDLYLKGEPKATEAYTSEQLKKMGMIGLYRATK